MIEHDPTATEWTCPACRLGIGGPYDHEAVRAARPADFDAQVKAMVQAVANGARELHGVTLGEGSQERAAEYFKRYRAG